MTREPQLTLVDRTEETWKTLSDVPNGSSIPENASALCQANTKACLEGTNRTGFLPDYFSQQKNWNLLDLPSFAFCDNPPLSGSGTSATIPLIFGRVNAGYRVAIYDVLPGPSAPPWPKSVAVASPKSTPSSQWFLVYFVNTPQDPRFFNFFAPPGGWDWLFFQYYRWLNPLNVPIVQPPAGFQLPYQLMKAAKNFTLVIAQMTANPSPTNYGFLQAGYIANLLSTLSPTGQVDGVILAAFSSGNNVLDLFLATTMANTSDKAGQDFLRDTVKEIYIFDPHESQTLGNSVLQRAMIWKRRATSPPAPLRVYTHTLYQPSFGQLLPNVPQATLRPGNPFFEQSNSKDVSVGYFPIGGNPKSNVWTRSCSAVPEMPGLKRECGPQDFDPVHGTIPALFLTDAARRSKLS